MVSELKKDRKALLLWLQQLARSSRRISIPYFRSGDLQVKRKSDHSPVTVADLEVEAYLRARMLKAFPEACIVGEEFVNPDTLPQSYWTIDPIDGTRAFSRGLPFWGTLIGKVERGKPVLGICDFPALDITMAGALGHGLSERVGTRSKRLLGPKQAKPLEQAVILHGGSCWWQKTRYSKGFQRLTKACYLERAYGDCYGYLWLFRGHADAVIEHGLQLWDIVPMAAMARSVGLNVFNAEGRIAFQDPVSVVGATRLSKTIATALSS